jgi:hypothetical protein
MAKDNIIEVPVQKKSGWFSKAILIGSIMVASALPMAANAQSNAADSVASSAGQTMLIVQANKDSQEKIADQIMAKLSKEASKKGVTITDSYTYFRSTLVNLLRTAKLNPSREMSFRIQGPNGTVQVTLNAGAIQSSFDVAMR